MNKIIFLSLIVTALLAHAKIIETDSFEYIFNAVDQDTLVVFDIDNTLARTETEFGSDEWFSHLVSQKMMEGYDYFSAIYLVLPLAYYAQFNLPLQLTDPILVPLFRHLKTEHINSIGLTSRGLYLAERTYEQLKNIGIVFVINHLYKNEFILQPLSHPCLYKYHIIFCGNNNKGEALLLFLSTINYYPKKIIFIDDKMSHVHAVEQALQTTTIEYLGIRYTGCDHHVHNFDPAKAESQLHTIKESNNITTAALNLFLDNN
jgi:hypothetical protein